MRPLAGCAALAVAAHAALLIWMLHARPGVVSSGPGPVALHVRVARPDTPARAEAEPAPAPAPTDQGTPPAVADEGADHGPKAAAAAPDPGPLVGPPAPRLDANDEPIPLPDAAMPEGGANLVAFVRLDGQGQVTSVDVAPEAALPRAFGDVVALGLQRVHLQPHQAPGEAPARGPLAYCLRVRFEPGEPQASIRWLPEGVQDRSRCLRLNGAAAAVEIERR